MWIDEKKAKSGNCMHLIHFVSEQESEAFYADLKGIRDLFVNEYFQKFIDELVVKLHSRQDNKYPVDGVWETTMLFSSEVSNFMTVIFYALPFASAYPKLADCIDRCQKIIHEYEMMFNDQKEIQETFE